LHVTGLVTAGGGEARVVRREDLEIPGVVEGDLHHQQGEHALIQILYVVAYFICKCLL